LVAADLVWKTIPSDKKERRPGGANFGEKRVVAERRAELKDSPLKRVHKTLRASQRGGRRRDS